MTRERTLDTFLKISQDLGRLCGRPIRRLKAENPCFPMKTVSISQELIPKNFKLLKKGNIPICFCFNNFVKSFLTPHALKMHLAGLRRFKTANYESQAFQNSIDHPHSIHGCFKPFFKIFTYARDPSIALSEYIGFDTGIKRSYVCA